MTSALVNKGLTTTNTIKSPANRFRSKLLSNARYRMLGNPRAKMIPTDDKMMRRISTTLSDKECVVIYVDEYVRQNVATPSFGATLEERGNLNFALRLAARHDALLVLSYCMRTHGANFKIIAERIELPHKSGASKDKGRVLENQSYMDKRIEELIRRNLDQWFNFHAWRKRS